MVLYILKLCISPAGVWACVGNEPRDDTDGNTDRQQAL